MQRYRLLLLAGTVLPALALAQVAAARPEGMVVAQGGPEERGPGGPGGPGHGGPGGPGGPRGGPGPERGGPERGGPERGGPGPAQRERPEPKEVPEPRQQRPEPREERQAPPRPQPQPQQQRERPEPRQEQPQREDRRPAQQDQRQQQQEQRQQREDRRPDARPDRSDTREERPGPPAGRPAPDRAPPAANAPRQQPQPQGGPDRPDRPDRPGPDRGLQDRDARPGPDRAAPGPERNAAPSAPNAAPGVPGRPVPRPEDGQRPGGDRNVPPPPPPPPANAAPGAPGQPGPGREGAPGADPNRPVPPNMRPGVPGRPFQPPGQPVPGQPGAPGVAPGQAPGQPPVPGQPPGQGQGQFHNDQFQGDRGGPGGAARGDFNVPGRPGYISGGFRENEDVRDYEQVRRDRREFSADGRTYYREPGRLIVQDRNGYLIRHDENERFRELDPRGYRYERQGSDYISYIDRPGGDRIYTVTDDDGRLLRRYRRYSDGREVVIIDNSYAGPPRPIYDDVVALPPPDIRIPRERYVVEYDQADPGLVYEALTAPPVVAVDRRYTLDQIRYSPDLRARMRSVDIDTINFDTGSWTVTPDQARRLSVIADAINKAVRANPQEVFLIEGYTDAVGSDIDNLSLSDRRAQSVATVLTQQFQVPPENLTTQGYGEQYLKVNTQAANRENRRVTVRRITPLLQQGGGQGSAPPPR